MVIKVFGVICLVLAVEGIVTSYLSKSDEKVEGTEQPVEVTPEKPIEQKPS
jgi:hypothetical protein